MKTKACILVVDDNRSLVRIMEGILQRQGYEIVTAYDGMEAVEKAEAIRPDLIVLDIVMPKLDGYEVCRTLQNDPKTAAIPVLMLSVKGQLDEPDLDDQAIEARLQEQIEGFEAGAADFITKPIKAKELEDRVQMLLWFSRI
jgi:two-component system, OmpR family, alkaline phosphatase synthesis response regulator PhoP